MSRNIIRFHPLRKKQSPGVTSTSIHVESQSSRLKKDENIPSLLTKVHLLEVSLLR